MSACTLARRVVGCLLLGCASLAAAQSRAPLGLTLAPADPDGGSTETLRRSVSLYLADLVEVGSDPAAALRLRFEFITAEPPTELIATLSAPGQSPSLVRSAWAELQSPATLRAFGLKLRSLVRVALLAAESGPAPVATAPPPPAAARALALELGGAPQLTSRATAAGQLVASVRGAIADWSLGLELGVSVARASTFSTGSSETVVYQPRANLRWSPLRSADGRWLGFVGLEAGVAIVQISALLQQTQARASATQLAPALGVNVGVTRALATWVGLALSPSVEVFPSDLAFTVGSAPAFQLGPVRARIDLRAVFTLSQ